MTANATFSTHQRPVQALQDAGDRRPVLLLSASVPYRRDVGHDLDARKRREAKRMNERYLSDVQPARIRAAVVELTRAALSRGWRLAFGAHPSISPMVLVAARDAGARPGSILIFQSSYFKNEIPEETYGLASKPKAPSAAPYALSDWHSGLFFWTEAGAGATTYDKRSHSLTLMREQMVTAPLLRGAVFIGGMDGLEEEAALFDLLQSELPKYALASTGSASRILWQDHSARFSGRLADPAPLRDALSYGLVAQLILDDLELD